MWLIVEKRARSAARRRRSGPDTPLLARPLDRTPGNRIRLSWPLFDQLVVAVKVDRF
jgi:hypothetical protein